MQLSCARFVHVLYNVDFFFYTPCFFETVKKVRIAYYNRKSNLKSYKRETDTFSLWLLFRKIFLNQFSRNVTRLLIMEKISSRDAHHNNRIITMHSEDDWMKLIFVEVSRYFQCGYFLSKNIESECWIYFLFGFFLHSSIPVDEGKIQVSCMGHWIIGTERNVVVHTLLSDTL